MRSIILSFCIILILLSGCESNQPDAPKTTATPSVSETADPDGISDREDVDITLDDVELDIDNDLNTNDDSIDDHSTFTVDDSIVSDDDLYQPDTDDVAVK